MTDIVLGIESYGYLLPDIAEQNILLCSNMKRILLKEFGSIPNDYGDGVSCYIFFYRLCKPFFNPVGNEEVESKSFFKPRKKEFNYWVTLDTGEAYLLYREGKPEVWQNHVCNRILDGITLMKNHPIKKFEVDNFYQDVKVFMQQKGWMSDAIKIE
jgi:hypothetical protein